MNDQFEDWITDNDTRRAVHNAVGGVLCNASNYPHTIQPRVLGQDMGPLIAKTVDAVMAALGIKDEA